MTYHVGRDRNVSGSLELRLAPDAARHFGRQAIDAVGKHGGMLVDARIDSEEAGAAQTAARADIASRSNDRAQIEQQLTKPGLGSNERTVLQQRLASLADENRQSDATARVAAFKLAQTPMTFDYQSGSVDLSLSDGPVLGAIKDGMSNIVDGFAMILLIVITLLPWIAVGAIIVWLWIRFFRWMNRPPTNV